MTAAQQLGSQIKMARLAAGLSLRKLASLTQIPTTTIEGYESGTSIPAEKLVRIADSVNHYVFRVDGYRFSVSRADEQALKAAGAEQLNLDFSAEYHYSKATVKISPGRIAVTFDGTRLTSELA